MPSTNPNEFQLLRRHMPELDVFRGVAILVVVVYHGFYWMNRGNYRLEWQTRFVDATVCGWLGVNLFFILSGFLITGILFKTKSAPDYYRSFYIKRSLRIFPALAAALILAGLLRQTSLSGLVLSIFFLVNYATNFGVTAIYGPLWSKSIFTCCGQQSYTDLRSWPLLELRSAYVCWSQRCGTSLEGCGLESLTQILT